MQTLNNHIKNKKKEERDFQKKNQILIDAQTEIVEKDA